MELEERVRSLETTAVRLETIIKMLSLVGLALGLSLAGVGLWVQSMFRDINSAALKVDQIERKAAALDEQVSKILRSDLSIPAAVAVNKALSEAANDFIAVEDFTPIPLNSSQKASSAGIVLVTTSLSSAGKSISQIGVDFYITQADGKEEKIAHILSDNGTPNEYITVPIGKGMTWRVESQQPSRGIEIRWFGRRMTKPAG